MKTRCRSSPRQATTQRAGCFLQRSMNIFNLLIMAVLVLTAGIVIIIEQIIILLILNFVLIDLPVLQILWLLFLHPENLLLAFLLCTFVFPSKLHTTAIIRFLILLRDLILIRAFPLRELLLTGIILPGLPVIPYIILLALLSVYLLLFLAALLPALMVLIFMTNENFLSSPSPSSPRCTDSPRCPEFPRILMLCITLIPVSPT